MEIGVAGLTLLALCALVGGMAFEVLVMSAEKAGLLRLATQAVRLRWLRGAILGVAVTAGLGFLVGLPIWIVLVRVMMCVGLWLLLSRIRPAREQWRMLLIGVLLLQTQSFVSRSARLPEPIMPMLADWFHLTLAAIWLGGVAMLALIIAQVWRTPSRETIAAVSGLLQRFSPIALFCVLGLAFSGIAQAGLFVKGFDELLNTSYGITLLIKLVLFVVLIGFGAFHQQRIMPILRNAVLMGKSEALANQAVAEITRLRLSLLLESGVGVALLLIVGMLVALRVTG